MALIDFDKFLASFITEMKECSQMRNFSIPRCIKKALVDQGLDYKGGEIIKTQRRVSSEAKENGYGESEDEKVRKELLAVVNDLVLPDEQQSRFIAWLEKQGEHANFRNNIQIGDKVTRNRDGVLVNLSQLNRVAKKDEKQGEQKHALDIEIPFGAKDSELQEATYLIPEGFHAEIEGDKVVIKKGKQKSAWSKEDEWKFSDILALLRGGENCHYNTPDLFDWLKSIKNRIKRE